MSRPSNAPRRTLLLTGASRGIGHATAIRFSSAGWRVITLSRHAFPEVCPWGAGPEDHIEVDLGSHDDTVRAISEIRRRLENDELHALVNNAAISPKAPGGGRLEQALFQMGEGQTVTRQKAQKPLRTYLKNIYFDSVIHDPKARQYLVDFAGADNVLIGSNFGGWDGVNGAAYVRELGLDEESERKILSTNAAQLFGLEERVKKLEARR